MILNENMIKQLFLFNALKSLVFTSTRDTSPPILSLSSLSSLISLEHTLNPLPESLLVIPCDHSAHLMPCILILKIQIDHLDVVRSELFGEHFLEFEEFLVKFVEVGQRTHF